MTLEEKEQIRLERLAYKDKTELKARGGYQRVFPCDDEEQ
jgi:hypothetical protein